MKAAVVHDFDHPPAYREQAEPTLAADEVLVTVRAAALSQLTRSMAAGRHYAAQGAALPFVPGTDGVGTLADGTRVYFAFPRPPQGSMAERVAVSPSACIRVPDALDDVHAAALANPAMSSWAALTERARLVPGETVLVHGATGASGRLAVQIARHLGAGRVIATGRSTQSEAALRALGADEYIPLARAPEALVHAFTSEITGHGVDVVLDYLWGETAGHFLTAATTHAPGAAARRIRYVQIGSLGGPTLHLHASALRSSGVELLGSGLGSLSYAALMRVFGEVLHAAEPAGLTIDAQAFPLADVERVWSSGLLTRVVFTP